MIWFNIKELEKRLINGEVSDKNAFAYLLTHLIFLTVAMHVSPDRDLLWVEWAHFFISLGATIWVVRKTFYINQEGYNKDYLKRFLSVSFVVGIRMTVLVLLVSFFVVIFSIIPDLLGLSYSLSSFQSAVLELGFFTVYLGLYNYLLITSFKRINSGENSGVPVKAV